MQTAFPEYPLSEEIIERVDGEAESIPILTLVLCGEPAPHEVVWGQLGARVNRELLADPPLRFVNIRVW